MAALRPWFPRLPSIIAAFESLSDAVLERSDLQARFKISERSALRLMHEFDGYLSNNAFVVRRSIVLKRLRGMLPAFQQEEERRENLRAALDAEQRIARARTIRIAPTPGHSLLMKDLPAAIQIRPGKVTTVTTECVGFEDYWSLQQLFAQISAHDLEASRAAFEDPETQKARKPESQKAAKPQSRIDPPPRIESMELCTFEGETCEPPPQRRHRHHAAG